MLTALCGVQLLIFQENLLFDFVLFQFINVGVPSSFFFWGGGLPMPVTNNDYKSLIEPVSVMFCGLPRPRIQIRYKSSFEPISVVFVFK